MAKKIITAALPYVNNQPHLGNVIGCVLSADAYNRFCKKNNEEVIYICGTDEYGTAIEMAAISEGKTPLDICIKNREIHKKIYDWFDIKFDYFGHTTIESHKYMVQSFFKKIYDNGFFEEKEIEQFYCDSCELFLADRYVSGTCSLCGYSPAKGDQCDLCGQTYKPEDLIDAKCTICDCKPHIRKTKHLFFQLQHFKTMLIDHYEKNKNSWSKNGREIFNNWINQELLPRCMTRDLKYRWGVPVPIEGFEEKVFYVWFDAPIGYFTFLKEAVGNDFDKWINGSELIQFMGKDNVFFHTVIFPSMVLATKDEYPMVNKLSVTEYLKFENKKFSKSNSHGIFGSDLVNNELGSSCIWRYYLFKTRPEGNDSNFTFEGFINSVNADLNNTIGNFCNRVFSYIKSKCGLKVEIDEIYEQDIKFKNRINVLYYEYLNSLKNIKLRDGIETILNIAKAGNEFLQQAIDSKKNVPHSFMIGFSVVELLGQILEPFLPKSSEKLLNMCRVPSRKFPEEFEFIKVWEISSEIAPLFSYLGKDFKSKVAKFAN